MASRDGRELTTLWGERGQCNHCGPCELNCPHKAKASTDITYWPLAIKAGARLFTKTRVTKILTDLLTQ